MTSFEDFNSDDYDGISYSEYVSKRSAQPPYWEEESQTKESDFQNDEFLDSFM